ncbi:hypothetical protein J4Q44_G00076110 [Coregonus suidteri]|uniref:IF rod domain-containing protein n=1 Tax=Coregonus suidteri TaxID=861788 RepID=A0AAN8R3J7_9TELE
MRGASYSQKSQSLQVSGTRSSMRVQSPSPSRCRGSSYNNRGRSGHQGGNVSSAVELGTEIHQVHANEKEEMQELNMKFAGYIEKVQALEQRNAQLTAELAALQGRFKGGPTGIGEEYNLKFKEMRELIEALTNEKGAADIERGYIEEEVEVWRMKLEEELALKEEAEMILREFREDVDNATLQKAELERRVEQLVAEIEFLKKLHDEEVADLMKQIEDSKVTAELDGDRPDLAAYLRNMRAEIETVAAKNVQEAEKWYKGKFETLKEVAGKKENQMMAMKEEITTFHSQVTDLQNQIDGLRASNVALEQQLQDMEMAHMDKVGGLEGIIAQLEHQLCETKMEMGNCWRERRAGWGSRQGKNQKLKVSKYHSRQRSTSDQKEPSQRRGPPQCPTVWRPTQLPDAHPYQPSSQSCPPVNSTTSSQSCPPVNLPQTLEYPCHVLLCYCMRSVTSQARKRVSLRISLRAPLNSFV